MYESETSTGLSPDQKTVAYAPGTMVRVTQQIPRRLDTYSISVTGTVIRQERQQSGSWFARNKNDRVWLDRLILQKADGEITILNLDEYSNVEVLSGPAPAGGESPLIEPSQDMTANIT
jgi:hypothetical protein